MVAFVKRAFSGVPEIPPYAIQLHVFLLFNLMWLDQAENFVAFVLGTLLTELPFSPSSDTDHTSESHHCSGHVEQLAQTHCLSALIPRKSHPAKVALLSAK